METVKGFRDFSGEEAEKREEIRKLLVETFERYGFEPAETPIIEQESFVKGENLNDEAVSDVFTLKDKGRRKLALRYEFTFQLKRLANNKKLPYKRYQIGPVFRDEPVSANRFRQFMQCDVDVVGSDVKAEAEILALTKEIMERLGITPVILVGNRELLNEVLEDQKIKEKDREQVLREIDEYDKLPEKQVRDSLKKFGAEKVLDALKKGEKYFKKFESYKQIISLMEYCRAYGIKIAFSPSVVRGLSYYNGNVFEIKTRGIRETLVAGGSYKVGDLQATGISFGLDRIATLAKIKKEREKTLVISLSQDREAIKLVQRLRKKGEAASLFYGKPSKALEYANSYGFSRAIFVGEKEVKAKKFKVKNLKTGKTTAYRN